MSGHLVFEVTSPLKKFFSISAPDQLINYTPIDHGADCALKSTQPLDPTQDVLFEVTLTSIAHGSVVAVGLTPRDFPCQGSLPGWTTDSVGYHSDDGNVFLGNKPDVWKVPGQGDTIGCGIEKGEVYFTLNKVKLQTNFPLSLTQGYYPTIGFSGSSMISYSLTLKQTEAKENIVFPSSIVVEGTSENNVRCVGNEVSCVNDSSDHYWTAKSNIPIKTSPDTTFYFEIKIQSIFKTGVIAIGLCTKDFPTSQSLPGWVMQSYGYHSDDGGIFANDGTEARMIWKPFGAGDVVGCGIQDGWLYFTRNKEKLETNLKLPKASFYMTVGMEHSSSWTWNFGSSHFVNSDITLNQFKQPNLASANQDHPLLDIPQCVWPLMVSNTLQKTKQRHRTWMALLSTCHALREYLLPLFITLSPSDYYLALEGYYIWETRMTDYYLQITRNNLTFISKQGSYDGEKNDWQSNKQPWRMERKVLSETKQQIVLVTKVFEISDFTPQFKFDRYQPTGLKLEKYTKERFKDHLESPKRIIIYRKCGAAVVTPEAPCCHESRRILSNVAK